MDDSLTLSSDSRQSDGSPVRAKSVGSELISEIERVSALRETYKSFRGMRGMNVEPAIYLMTGSIEAAKDAILSDDPARCITCLETLRGFSV